MRCYLFAVAMALPAFLAAPSAYAQGTAELRTVVESCAVGADCAGLTRTYLEGLRARELADGAVDASLAELVTALATVSQSADLAPAARQGIAEAIGAAAPFSSSPAQARQILEIAQVVAIGGDEGTAALGAPEGSPS